MATSYKETKFVGKSNIISFLNAIKKYIDDKFGNSTKSIENIENIIEENEETTAASLNDLDTRLKSLESSSLTKEQAEKLIKLFEYLSDESDFNI